MKNLKVILVYGCLYSFFSMDCVANPGTDLPATYYLCDQATLLVDNSAFYTPTNDYMLIKLTSDEIMCVSEKKGNFIQKSYPVKAFGSSSEKSSYYIEEQTTKYVLNKLMNTITAYEKLGYDNGKMEYAIRTTWKIQPLTESEYQEAMKLKKERINAELVLNQAHFTISSFNLNESHSISCVAK
ncbi:MAG: hypothetical protein ABJF04_13220 [Reichenbachiella sp.]|uniref:hypothetical protein n=1 Tax=Reichenbachiella sp. TaxID=2184521 RepID=UPI003266F970